MGSELSHLRAERELLSLRSILEDLGNEDWQLRVRSLKSLATIRKTSEFMNEAVPMILNSCHDENNIVREAAIPLLGDVGVGQPHVIESLQEILQRTTASEVKAATYALGKIGPDALSSLPIFIQLLESSQSEELNKAVSWSISMLGPDAVPEIINILKSGENKVNQYLIPALGNMGPIAIPALDMLLQHLESENPRLRLEAAKAVGNLRAAPEISNAIPNLETKLEDNDPDVRWAVAEALRKIGTEDAMKAWASYSEISSADAYLQQLANDDKAVRLNAAEQLFTVLEPNSRVDFHILGKALRDTYYKVQVALCVAIAKLEDSGEPLADALLEILDSDNPLVRSAALTTLGKINAASKDEEISKFLEDEEKEVRLAAGLALELLDTPKAQKSLKKFKWE